MSSRGTIRKITIGALLTAAVSLGFAVVCFRTMIAATGGQ